MIVLAVIALIGTSLVFPSTAAAQTTAATTQAPAPTTAPVAADPALPETRTPATSPQTPTPSSPATSPTGPEQQRPVSEQAPAPLPAQQARAARAPEQRAGSGGDIAVSIGALQRSPIPLAPGESLTVGETVQVEGIWDASTAQPKSGDVFSIGFPSALRLEDGLDFPLTGTDDVVWGTCEIDAAANLVTCVLSDAVEDRPEEVKGTFFLFSEAVERVTVETVSFELNGTATPIDLPGTGGIGDGKTIGDAAKTGALQPDKSAIRWTIDIPGGDLAALDPTGTGTVTLSDTLSDTMQLCEAPRLGATLQSGRPGDLKPADGGVSVTQPGGAGTPIAIAIATGTAFRTDLVYRVQYTTCTVSGGPDLPAPGGDPVVYENSVTIGDTVVASPGVTQDWTPSTMPSKGGSINTGNRFRSVNWEIMVPGSFIAAKADHRVTIDEKLVGEHAVCESGLNVKIARADYLPGPDGRSPAKTDVTGEFDLSTTAVAGATTFGIDFRPKDISGFEAEQYYYVTFATCVTTDKPVPTDLDVFRNEASVNGAQVAWQLAGPRFTASKNGAVNNAPKTVAGEAQPAGSTIDWKVEIPGQHLEDLDRRAVINDLFSDTMAVCEIGDDLKTNLNLKVIARDFRGDAKVNPERDLTEGSEVTLIDGGLSLTLPKAEGDYSREIRYFLQYTLCTSSGGLDKRGTTYSNALAYEGRKMSTTTEQRSGGGGTGQGVSRGSFSLTKSLAPSSAEFPIDETTFTVRVEEFAPGVDPATGRAESTYTVAVKADGTPVSGLNARGSGWTIRLTEIDLPVGNGVYFEPGRFEPGTPGEPVAVSEDRTQAIVTIKPKTNAAVTLVNKAQLGTATVTKKVVGDAAGELSGNEKFVFRANIDRGVEGAGTETREFTLQNGQFYDLGRLPIGATVTFSEEKPVDTDRITWAQPVIEPSTLVVGTDPAANAVSVTNTASITQGTFTLAKKLTGPEASSRAVPESFEVRATWNDGSAERNTTLILPADGTEVPFGENLPGGTTVTLTEVVPANGNGLSWGVPAFSGAATATEAGSGVVTIGKNSGRVTVTNFVDTNDGTLRLTKQVGGEAAEATADAEFAVEARWKDGTEFRTTTLTVTQGESTPLGVDLPVGTEVTFTEVDRPEIPGVEWGDISWGTDPVGGSWLVTGPSGTATGIVSDNPTEGRLVTLHNEALWSTGSIGFSKFVFDGENPVPAADADLPEGTSFEVQIDGIDPALPEGVDFPAVGDRITLDAGNDWTWKSGDVLPKGTVVTFSEVDPEALDGISWERPFYFVAADAGEPGDRDSAEIAAGEQALVEVRNRPIPTTEVDISKVVSGPKGRQVSRDPSTAFQVTATWTDVDGEERSCLLDVTPTGGMTPTAECDATVIDGGVQFPLNTQITVVETGAYTAVSNVNWGNVNWNVTAGNAEIAAVEGEPAGIILTLTGEAGGPVSLELENETSSRGLILFPFPIPLPPFDGGSSTPSGPGSSTPPGPPVPADPASPGAGSPLTPAQPGTDALANPGQSDQSALPANPHKPAGHNGAPGKPAPGATAHTGGTSESPALAVTGANVVWLGGAALALVAAGAWLMLRTRRGDAAQ